MPNVKCPRGPQQILYTDAKLSGVGVVELPGSTNEPFLSHVLWLGGNRVLVVGYVDVLVYEVNSPKSWTLLVNNSLPRCDPYFQQPFASFSLEGFVKSGSFFFGLFDPQLFPWSKTFTLGTRPN